MSCLTGVRDWFTATASSTLDYLQDSAFEGAVSFTHHKIDYNHCLGAGVYGVVFAVVLRPEREKGVLSNLCPYAYDFIFRADLNAESTDLCVKISKSALRILLENAKHPLPFSRPLESLYEISSQKRFNFLFRKYGLTDVDFYPAHSLYAQFKTRVRGKTFRFYIENHYFENAGQFVLRKALVQFLSKILNPGIGFSDLHVNNIMFDEVKERWSVVDGCIRERENILSSNWDNISWLFESCNLNLWGMIDNQCYHLIRKLCKITRQGIPYTLEIDQQCLQKIESLKPDKWLKFI